MNTVQIGIPKPSLYKESSNVYLMFSCPSCKSQFIANGSDSEVLYLRYPGSDAGYTYNTVCCNCSLLIEGNPIRKSRYTKLVQVATEYALTQEIERRKDLGYKCRECEGKGRVPASREYPLDDSMMKCPACQGYGWLN